MAVPPARVVALDPLGGLEAAVSARDDAWADWWAHVMLPASASKDVAHEAFCAGWEAARQVAIGYRAIYFAGNSADGIKHYDFADLLGGEE